MSAIPIISSWDDVNLWLKRLGEIHIATEDLEGRMTLEINTIKDAYAPHYADMAAEKKIIEAAIKEFVEANKAEFLKIRTKTFDFGTVALRVTKKIAIRNVKAVIAAIKGLGWMQCIRIKEEPDKEALDGLSDQELARIGVKRVVEDKLRIEPNIERLREAA